MSIYTGPTIHVDDGSACYSRLALANSGFPLPLMCSGDDSRCNTNTDTERATDVPQYIKDEWDRQAEESKRTGYWSL